MNKTGIEYLNYTWNPIAMRCIPVSEGCKNCWHLRMCKRHVANPKLSQEMREARGGGQFHLMQEELEAPLRLKKPVRIGVQFMGDLFLKSVTDEMLDEVFSVMAQAQQHTFFVLTKRPERMGKYLDGCAHGAVEMGHHFPWTNIWLGVSVENQKAADERIQILVDFTEKLKMNTGWISVEPMLEEIRFPYFRGHHGDGGIRWVVCGAESGPGARLCNVSWVRSLKNQCLNAGVPFFYKQGPSEDMGFPFMSMPLLGGQRWAQTPEAAA